MTVVGVCLLRRRVIVTAVKQYYTSKCVVILNIGTADSSRRLSRYSVQQHDIDSIHPF